MQDKENKPNSTDTSDILVKELRMKLINIKDKAASISILAKYTLNKFSDVTESKLNDSTDSFCSLMLECKRLEDKLYNIRDHLANVKTNVLKLTESKE